MNTIDHKDFEAVIGLEVHAQLLTQSKAFAPVAAQYGQAPNTQVSPLCLGHPGDCGRFITGQASGQPVNEGSILNLQQVRIACNFIGQKAGLCWINPKGGEAYVFGGAVPWHVADQKSGAIGDIRICQGLQ